MEFEFTFDDEGQQVTIILTGRPTPFDFRRLVERLVADSRFRRGLLHLVDCSRLDVIEGDETLEEEMAPLVERDWQYPPRAVAIVAPDGELYTRALLARAHMGGSLINRRVFTNVAEASHWLAEQRD